MRESYPDSRDPYFLSWTECSRKWKRGKGDRGSYPDKDKQEVCFLEEFRCKKSEINTK